MVNIGIITYETDLHGLSIKTELQSRPGVTAHLLSIDSVVINGGISWSSDKPQMGRVRSMTGEWFKPSDLDLLWWRRINQPLYYPQWLSDPIERDFISHEWKASLFGLLHDDFKGVWINDPSADLRAGNKLHQLSLAARVGLPVPRTLISQQPAEVRAFCQELGGRMVVKKIAGSQLRHTISVVAQLGSLPDDDSIRLCPAIYQEVIDSRRHLRVNCFGDSVYAVLIESDVFDWRQDLNVPFTPYQIDSTIKEKLARLLDCAGLRMGIMDMIVRDDCEPIWLELNPQGQFLFCEALGGINLTAPFADFLIREANRCTFKEGLLH